MIFNTFYLTKIDFIININQVFSFEIQIIAENYSQHWKKYHVTEQNYQ